MKLMGEIKDLVFDYARLGFIYGFLFGQKAVKKKVEKFLKEQEDDFFFKVKEAAIEDMINKLEKRKS